MNAHKTIISISLTIICLIAKPVWAMHESGHDLSDEEWSTIKDKIELLDNLNYLPTSLPTIMRHRDVLELTDEQLSLIHISEPTRPRLVSRMPSSA